jgi:hypothetical protein
MINTQPDQSVSQQYNRRTRNTENAVAVPFTLNFHNEEPRINIESETSDVDIPNPLRELMRSLVSSQPMTRQNIHQPLNDTHDEPTGRIDVENNEFAELKSIAERLIRVNSSDDSDPPDRFVANQRDGREVLIQANTTEANTTEANTTEANTTEANTTEANTTETRRARSVHSSVVGNMNRIGIHIEQIQGIARKIHRSITDTQLRPPDFNNKSRTGYRKIKNFIYNLTKVWLNQSEIDSFIEELNLIEESDN